MPLKISDLQAQLEQQRLEWSKERSAPDEADIPIIFPKYQTKAGRKKKKPSPVKATGSRRSLTAAQRRKARRRRAVLATIARRANPAPSPVADRDIFAHRAPPSRGYATSYATDDWREQK